MLELKLILFDYRLLQHHKHRPTTTELFEIITKLDSESHSKGEDEHHNDTAELPKNECNAVECEENMTNQSKGPSSASHLSASFEQISVSMKVASSKTSITTNNGENGTNTAEKEIELERVNDSFDADAMGDDNDSILASIASIDDKDKLIQFLTHKLVEKNRRESEMSQEIERLRNLLK